MRDVEVTVVALLSMTNHTGVGYLLGVVVAAVEQNARSRVCVRHPLNILTIAVGGPSQSGPKQIYLTIVTID